MKHVNTNYRTYAFQCNSQRVLRNLLPKTLKLINLFALLYEGLHIWYAEYVIRTQTKCKQADSMTFTSSMALSHTCA